MIGKKVTDFDEKVSGEKGAVGLIESMYLPLPRIQDMRIHGYMSVIDWQVYIWVENLC